MIDRHELELSATDGTENAILGHEHPGTGLARRGPVCRLHLDQHDLLPSIQKTPDIVAVRWHGTVTPLADRNRSIAINTHSGVAGASRRGEMQ